MNNIIKLANGLDNDIKKCANIFLATGYCDRLWYDALAEHDEMDEECGGIYLVHGEGEDEFLEYMSPLLHICMISPYILNQVNCLEQFFEIKTDSPDVKIRQDILRPIVEEWDGVVPDTVKPFKNAVKLL